MSRKFWIISGIVLAAFVVLGAAGAGGYFLYRQHETRTWLNEGNEAFEKGDWETAIRRYGFYLNRRRDDLETLERYAQASLQQGGNRRTNLAQAAMAYRQILHYDPSREEILKALFDLQKKLGSWHEVHYLAGLMLEKDPGNADLKFEQAHALDRLGNRNEAISAYRELIDQGVAKPDVYANLARQLRETNLIQQAEDVVNQAVEAHPDNPKTFVVRGEYYLEDRDLKKASAELDKAKALAPDDLDVVQFQARLALLARDLDTAIDSARNALQRDPAQARMYLVLSQGLANKGEKEASLEVLRNVDPALRADNPELFVSFAEQLINEQELEEAQEVIGNYESVYPDHQMSLNYLKGRIELVEGNADAAEDRLAAVIEQNPTMASARFFLAVANLIQGKRKEARNHLELYLKANPDDESAKRLLAEASGVQPDPEQLLQAAQKVLGNEQAQANALVSSALALLGSALREGTATEQLDTIQQLFNRAIEQDPSEASAYGGLVDAYVAAGNTAMARQTLQRAEQQGVPARELLRAQANVALAEGNTEAAWKQYELALQEESVTVDFARQWARFFLVREQSDFARKALSLGEEHVQNESEKAQLAVENLLLELRLGREHEVLHNLRKVEARVAGHEAAEQTLNQVKGQLVWRMLEEGDQAKLEQARQILSEGRGDGQDDPMLLSLKGIMALRATPPRYDEAEAAFEKALQSDGESVAALMGMASVASSQGALSQALEYATQASEIAVESDGIDLWRAEILYRMQRYLEARDTLERVLAQVPDNESALELMVNTYIATDQLREAERVLERLSESAQTSPERAETIEALRGRILLARGDTADAVTVLRQQHAANPDDFATVRSLAFALAQQGQLDDSESLLKEYVETHRTEAEAFVTLARFYLGLNDPAKLDAASTALTRALLLDSNYLPALRALVDVQVRRGRSGDILAACNRYLIHDPLNAGVLYVKASLLSQEAGSESEALDVINQAIAQERRPDYLALRGMLHLRDEAYAEALKDLRDATLENPDTPAQLDAALAEAYWGLAEKDLAQSYYESALEKLKATNDANPPWLARLKEKMGQEN